MIYLGLTSQKKLEEGIKVKVKSVIPHESFVLNKGHAEKGFDIGLLELETALKFTGNQEKLKCTCVLKDDKNADLKNCAAVGWGRLKRNGTAATILQEVNFTASDDCPDYPILNKTGVLKGLICAGGHGKTIEKVFIILNFYIFHY